MPETGTLDCGDGAAALPALPDADVLSESVMLMKGFADETRLALLTLLRDGPVCVHELVGALDLSPSAISHQLRVLRHARLVRSRKEGRHVYYRLADDHVRRMLDDALSHGAEAR